MTQIINRIVEAIVSFFVGAFKSSGVKPMPPPPPFPVGTPPTPPPTPDPHPPPVIPPTPSPPIIVSTPISALYDTFYQHYNGSKVNYTNNPYGAQCVEGCNAWCGWLHIELFPGNAADFEFDRHPDCDWIANTPTNYPVKGDIVVWGKSPSLPWGHCGICDHADIMHLATFDQNWPYGTPMHVQAHTYAGVRGWLRPWHWIGNDVHRGAV